MKTLFLLAVIFFSYSQSNCQLLIENFSYPKGTRLNETTAWHTITTPNKNAITVLEPGLNFPSYPGSGIGNTVAMGLGGDKEYSLLNESKTFGAVYAFFMLWGYVTEVDGPYFFALGDPEGNNYARIHIKENGEGYNVGITKSIGNAILYAPQVCEYGGTYLVCVKYEFLNGVQDDEISLFVFSANDSIPATEPAPDAGPFAWPVPDADSLDRVVLWQDEDKNGNPYMIEVDGIYVYDSWIPEEVLPVELASFSSRVNNRNVLLDWSTSSEINNSHFIIERSNDGKNTWTAAGRVEGNGSVNQIATYSFTDKDLISGTYNYRLKQNDFNGNYQYYNLNNDINISAPEKFSLHQNYPNPFNPATRISYEIPYNAVVSLKVFDLAGKEISTLINEMQQAGYHSIVFEASKLSSGVYYYKFSAESDEGSFSEIKKMIVVK